MAEVGFLRRVDPAEGRIYWRAVRPALEAMAERCGEPWIADDVWAEILAGASYLCVAGEPDALECFVILQIRCDIAGRALHVWAVSELTAARAIDYWPQLNTIAAIENCNRITGESARRGWLRAIPGARVTHTYTFEVDGDGHGRL